MKHTPPPPPTPTTSNTFDSKLLTVTISRKRWLYPERQMNLIPDKEQFTGPHRHDTEKHVRALAGHAL